MRIPALARQLQLDLPAVAESIGLAMQDLNISPDRGADLNLYSLVRTLNTHLRPYLIRVKTYSDEEVRGIPFDKWFMDGHTYSNPGQTPRIRIRICHDPATRRVPITQRNAQNLPFRLIELISHELIHRYQFEYRRQKQTEERVYRATSSDPQLSKDQQYHGSFDEIEAYSHDAVQDIWHAHADCVGNRAATLAMMKQVWRNPPVNSKKLTFESKYASILYYHETFGPSMGHPAVRMFFRKAGAWAETMPPLKLFLP